MPPGEVMAHLGHGSKEKLALSVLAGGEFVSEGFVGALGCLPEQKRGNNQNGE
jgi:hypothetical protein